MMRRYDVEPDRTIYAADHDALLEWQGRTNEACRYCGGMSPRGHARCGHCSRTLWRVRGEDQR